MREHQNVDCVLVLHIDRLCAETVRRVAENVFPQANIRLAHTIVDSRITLGEYPVDLLITGTVFPDGDILDLLAELLRDRGRARRIFIIASPPDQRTTSALNGLPIDGIFDPLAEDPDALEVAFSAVNKGIGYWSPTIAERMQQNFLDRNSVCRLLTPTEQLVFAVLGDGSDNAKAAKQLGLAESTVLSVRGELHRKLHVRKQGDLIRLAVQYGFVRIMADSVVIPGYSMLVAGRKARVK